MALVIDDRVRETTQVTGTGSATLLGAVTGYQSFSVIGNGNTTYYTIADQGGPNWEVGIGTWSTGGTLARTTVLSSSNGGSLVNFTAGTKDVFVTQPSEKAVTTDSIYTGNAFAGTYTDGFVHDYVTGMGRLSVGSGDGITFYTGGVGTTSIGSVSSAGIWTLPTLNLTNALGVAYGGTGQTSFTSGYVLYGNGTSGLAGSANMTFNGTSLTLANDAYIHSLTVGLGNNSIAGNTALGISALGGANSGTGRNTAVGNTALISNTSGSDNTALGYAALYANTTGNYNVAVGGLDGVQPPLRFNTTGSSNAAVGNGALAYNTTGNYNNALGFQALYSNTTASNNTAVGYQAGYSNTTGSIVALGSQAGYSNTTGAITAIGLNSLLSNTTGSNTAIGWATLQSNTTGTSNTAVGGYDGSVSPALRYNTTGNYNSAFGIGALGSNTTASNNTAVGYQALYTNTTSNGNTAVGYQAGQLTTSGGNAFFGIYAGQNNTTGSSNTFLGGSYALSAGNKNTTGSSNTAVGTDSLANNTTASNNTAVGYQAGYSNTTGALNTFLGGNAGYLSTGSGNTFVGQSVGYNTTGSYNTFIGLQNGNAAGAGVTTGSNNVIIGGYTGATAPISATGSNYIVLSDGAGNPRLICAGNGSVGIGFNPSIFRSNDNALIAASSSGGGQNIILEPADFSVGLNYNIQTGNYYTQSYYAGKISFYNGQVQVLTAPSGTAGNSITFTAGPYVANGGTSWTNSSDANLKNITGIIENALDKISQLRAARFTWKADESNTPQVGLIAQDLQKVLPEVVVVPKEPTDQNGNPTHLGVNYDQVIPLLLAGIQELNTLVTTQAAQIAALQAKVGA